MPSPAKQVLDFEAPDEWPLPSAAVIEGKGATARLRIVPGLTAEPPHPGAWRSVAEAASPEQILAVARRYGSLTREAWEGPGEPLRLWHELIEVLRQLAAAWDNAGAPAEAEAQARALYFAAKLHAETVASHGAQGGQYLPSVFTVAMWCRDLRTWWQRSAIADVVMRQPMRRCRFCGAWISSRERRSDAGFCTAAHRSAFHQQRQPKSSYWAEA